MNRVSMTWEEFASRVRTSQIGFMGEANEVKPGRGEFHEYPSSCICEYPEANSLENPNSWIRGIVNRNDNKDVDMKKESVETTDDHLTEDEQDADETDYTESENAGPQGKGLWNRRNSSFGIVSKAEEIFSD